MVNVFYEICILLILVRGYVEVIFDGVIKDKEEERRYFSIILKEIFRMYRLVNSFLDLLWIEFG